MRLSSYCARRAGFLPVSLLLWLAAPATAQAGGFYSPYQSATAIGTAFAGASVRDDDLGFFLYNPATAARIKQAQTWSDARAFFPEATIEPSSASTALGGDITGDGGSGNIAGRALAAGSVSAIPIAPGLTLAFGSSAPFATSIETSPDWGGRFHVTKAHMVGMNAQGAVAWQVTPWLALAGGIQVQRFVAEFRNAALIPTATKIVETTASLDGRPSWAAGAVAGATLSLAEGSRIGIGWRSQMTHTIEGTARATLPGTPVEELRFDIDLPQMVSLGVEHRLAPALRVFGEVQWLDWSRFQGFDIAFASGRPNELRRIEWQDTWLFAGGLGVKLSPSSEITAGLSYESAAAVNASGTTLSADAAKTTIGLGLLHDIAGLGRISLSYAHVFVHEAPVFASSAASGTLEGTLNGRLDTLGASLTVPW